MKKVSKLSLKKETLAKLEKSEMSEVLGKGLYTTDMWLGSSVNTAFTNIKSCCGGNCARTSCYHC